MNIEPNPTVATSARTRRTVLSVAIAVIATIPIAAGSSAASDETTSADTTDHRPRRQQRRSERDTPTRLAPEPTIGTNIVVDVRLTFTLPDGWENNGWFVVTSNSARLVGVVLDHVGQHLHRSLPMGGG